MKEITQRGLMNAVHYLLTSSEMDRVRAFLTADASAEKSESDEIILYVANAVRDHLLTHGRSVRAIAASKRAV